MQVKYFYVEISSRSDYCRLGSELVIEEYLDGPEISVLAFSDGYTIIPLPAAQDHKRIGDGDTGPNTGGMGAYSPAPVATPHIMQRIMKESLQPTIDGIRRDGAYLATYKKTDILNHTIGSPFVGLLFTGFLLTDDGPKVLEYNVRFGDPETEALMLLLSDETDLAQVLLVCIFPDFIYFYELIRFRPAPNTDWIRSPSLQNPG